MAKKHLKKWQIVQVIIYILLTLGLMWYYNKQNEDRSLQLLNESYLR